MKNVIFLNFSKNYFPKPRARGSTLEASVMVLKTTIHECSRLRARGSIHALASVREELNHLGGGGGGFTPIIIFFLI